MKNLVAIVIGSKADLDTIRNCTAILEKFDIKYTLRILSAHRTPEQTKQFIHQAEQDGCQVFVAAAGLAAHLAGTVAAHTLKPVIGIPLAAGSLNGMDSLLSTVQMPSGIPVATVAIGSAGAKNAAFLAAQILSLNDASLAQKLLQQRQEQVAKIMADNENIQV